MARKHKQHLRTLLYHADDCEIYFTETAESYLPKDLYGFDGAPRVFFCIWKPFNEVTPQSLEMKICGVPAAFGKAYDKNPNLGNTFIKKLL